MMRRAFTLIELVVAMGILALVMVFASVIFRISLESQRQALANAEIMQKLRVISEQLDADFRGGIFEYGGYLSAAEQRYMVEGEEVTVNSDCIVFLAGGSFQSTEQYDGETVTGNVACIFYGQPDPGSYTRMPAPQDRVLLRRQTILTVEGPEDDSDPRGEYYRQSLAEWQVECPFDKPNDWTQRPVIEPNDVRANLPMYIAEGVGDFTIHYLPAGANMGTDGIDWQRDAESASDAIGASAFKFTFTLYDSKGLIKDGRTFTHIVLVGG